MRYVYELTHTQVIPLHKTYHIMNKRVIVAISITIGILVILMIFGGSKDTDEVLIQKEVQFGSFRVEVNTSGELEAENSTKIMGPQLNKIWIWNANIEDIVPEGTVVDSGAYVGKVEASEVADKLNEAESNLEISETHYSNTVLDTTLELRDLRDKLVNLEFELEEAKIKLEQSKYEPPATIRQEEINKERKLRQFNQALENYKVKVKKAESRMKEASINRNKAQHNVDKIAKLSAQLNVFAPKAGMVIYTKDWGGNKVKKGSRINTWNPVVAELPDLSQMISKTYINEIDISKVSKGQKVAIGIDAFPDLNLSGEVINIANIGEQLKNSDAKVFEVLIRVNEVDSTMRPAMTTSNEILINEYDSVLYTPIESVFGNDTIKWVYKVSGITKTKQEVRVGEANENDIIIKKGLNEGDKVLLSPPKNEDKLELVFLKPDTE